MTAEYKIIRSDRKTLSIEVKRDLSVIVRAPKRVSDEKIRAFVEKYSDWIDEHVKMRRRSQENAPKEPSEEEIKAMRELAKREIAPLVNKYAAVMNVKPSGVKITSARSRLGSCSPKNSLCFSLFLMSYPKPVIEYVVVHELAHILHKNHGMSFYAEIGKIIPDFQERRKEIREISKN